MTEEDETRQVLIQACEHRGKAAEIAKSFEVSPSTVKRWVEGGEIPPPMVKLLRLYLLGEIPFGMIHPKQDLRAMLTFEPDEFRVIETLALREGIAPREWIKRQIVEYLNFLEARAVRMDGRKPLESLKVAEDEPKSRGRGA